MRFIGWFFPFPLCASFVGDPGTPQLIREGFISASNNFCLSARTGYEGDFVSDARMKQTQEGSGDVDNFRQITNAGTVTLGVLERADFYALFGASRIDANWRFLDLSEATNRIEFETDSGFLWGVGGRFILYEWGHAILGIGGRYCETAASPSWMTFNGAPDSTAASSFAWNQWQLNLLFSYKIDLFVPYLGMNYLSGHAKLSSFPMPISASESDSLSMENRSSTGLVIGCSLSTGRDFMLDIESRLINEEAYSITADIKF